MLRRGSQAARRAVAAVARAHPECSLAAAGACSQQRAGFATIYDVNPTPYEVRPAESKASDGEWYAESVV